MRPQAMFNSPQAPADFQVEMRKVKQRQDLARALQQQSLEPSGGTQMVSGRAVFDPFSPMAKVAQAIAGSRQASSADTEATNLATKRRADVQQAVTGWSTVSGDPNATPQQKQAAHVALMGTLDPEDTQTAARMAFAQSLDPKAQAQERLAKVQQQADSQWRARARPAAAPSAGGPQMQPTGGEMPDDSGAMVQTGGQGQYNMPEIPTDEDPGYFMHVADTYEQAGMPAEAEKARREGEKAAKALNAAPKIAKITIEGDKTIDVQWDWRSKQWLPVVAGKYSSAPSNKFNQAPLVNVYQNPIAVHKPETNEDVMVQFGKGGKSVETPYTPAHSDKAAKMPAEIQRQQLSLSNLTSGLDNYEKLLKSVDPRSLDQLDPQKKATIEAAMADLVINWKEAAALGALTGPDVALIERAMTDPLSAKGAWYGQGGLMSQLAETRKSLQRRQETFASQYPQSKPKAPGAPQPSQAPKTAAPTAKPATAPPAGETKMIGGKKYLKQNGQWFEVQ